MRLTLLLFRSCNINNNKMFNNISWWRDFHVQSRKNVLLLWWLSLGATLCLFYNISWTWFWIQMLDDYIFHQHSSVKPDCLADLASVWFFFLDEVGRCWVRGSTYPWIQKLKKWLPASVFPPLSFRAWMGAETDSVLGFSPLINTFLWRKNRPVLTELIWKKLTNKKKICGIQTWVFRQIKLWPQQSAVHTAVGRGQLVQSGETQVGQELHFALGKDAACTTIITQTRWDFGPRQFKDDFMSDSDICTRPPL